MTDRLDRQYLSLNEQQKILSKLQTITNKTPLIEKFAFHQGENIQALTLFACGAVLWRCGFRGFYLQRYAKARITTLFLSQSSFAFGTLIHSTFVNRPLYTPYRSENVWNYGLKSLLVHQIGLFITSAFSLGGTFAFAHRFGIVPVADQPLKAGCRRETLTFIVNRLKPYKQTILTTWALSSIFMFCIGLVEYEQSRGILAKINRKSLIYKE